MSNKPKRQHYIPRSYLNNFASKSKKKYFIHGKVKGEDKIDEFSTKDICVKKDLYTIPAESDDHKFAIENFYADKIDGVYPEVYKILTDDSITEINFDTRLKIINTILSLYFRTPKFLNLHNQLIEQITKDIANYKSDTEIVKADIFGQKVEFKKGELEETIKKIKEQNRISFLFGHLEIYEKFVMYKLKDGIGVNKLVDDSLFITSDNPVIIRDGYNLKNIFDPKNIIHLPLNEKYLLTLTPKSEPSLEGTFHRIEGTLWDSLTVNSDIEKYSENWILGSKKSLEKHLDDQIKYNEETPENLKKVDEFKEKALKLNSFINIAEKYGLSHPKTIAEIEKLKDNPLINDDPNFVNMLKEIREKGIEI